MLAKYKTYVDQCSYECIVKNISYVYSEIQSDIATFLFTLELYYDTISNYIVRKVALYLPLKIVFILHPNVNVLLQRSPKIKINPIM